MPVVMKVTYRHHNDEVTAFVIQPKGRNGYALAHTLKRPRDVALFADETAAIEALDTLWDNTQNRLRHEIIQY